MKTALALSCLLVLTGAAGAETQNFDSVQVGQLPEGWVAGVTGGGSPKWAVVQDDSAPSKPNVLKQSGEGTFPWCVKKDASLVDGFVEVKFKPISGSEDQAGGLVWRWQDGNNYYIARANALEDNVTIYHTVKGQRESFKSVSTKVTSGAWHTLRVDFKGQHFTVSFDGTKVIEADDATFSKAGAVGVWTKADSVTLFDDFTLSSSSGAQEVAPLTLVQTTPLEGVEGRIDHMAIDSKLQRLYVAALGNNTVEVIDLATGKRSGQIKGLNTPQGIRVLPDTGTLVVASGGDGKCRFYDKDQKLIAMLDGLEDADNVRYDSDAKLIYVGYGDGALAVIDPEKHAKIADIKLEGHPESFQLEAKGNRIFVNVPTAKQVAVIDREKRVVVAIWPVREAESNFPMVLDEANHRLLIGCRKPAKVLVLDANSGKAVASIQCCGDADDMFYDVLTKRLYVSGGEGLISVIERENDDHYRLASAIKTAAGARTSMFDPSNRKLYLAVPHRDRQPAELHTYTVQQ